MLRTLLRMIPLLCTALAVAAVDDRFPPYDNTAEVEAFWKSKPEFFQWKTLADLPADLKWERGEGLSEMGDPAAKKGGHFQDFTTSFPATLRTVGDGAGLWPMAGVVLGAGVGSCAGSTLLTEGVAAGDAVFTVGATAGADGCVDSAVRAGGLEPPCTLA